MARIDNTQLTRLQQQLDPTIENLIKIHSTDPDLFLALAMDDLDESADAWIKALSILARRLREMVIRGFEIRRRTVEKDELLGAGHTVVFRRALEPSVVAFMRLLNGVNVGAGGRDYRGSEISEKEMVFALGDPSTWEADEARLHARSQMVPRVLQIADDDKAALLSGTPAYAIYSLQRSAPRVVAAPDTVYQGLRQSGPLAEGLAFCGHPKHVFGNHGEVIETALTGMVFMVYADREGYVFDWDWVKAQGDDTSSPDDTESRFRERIESPEPTVLSGVSDLRPGNFTPKAWWSSRGDCVFYYISDEPSFAQWVNDDLTIFWSFGDPSVITGCKVKNISRFLQNTEATNFQRTKGHLPLAYFLGRSLSVQALNGHTRHYGELVQKAEQSGTEVLIELPPHPDQVPSSY